MEIYQFTQEERAKTGFTHRVKLTHSDLTETATNTAQTIQILPVTDGTLVDRVAMRLVTPFQDASDAAFNSNTLIVGDGGSTNRFLTSQQLNVNGTEILGFAGTNTTGYVYLADDTVDVVIGSMSAKALVDIDVGEVWIFIRAVDLDLYADD
jgi:hypothetical protein